MKALLFLSVLLLSISFSIHWISAEEGVAPPKKLTFQELEMGMEKGEASLAELNGSTVQIRGFLYAAKEGSLVLAAEPNLKTCCIGSDAKKGRQLLVYGDSLPSTPSDFAVTLKGTLEIVPDGRFNFSLKNSTIEEAPSRKLSFWAMGSLFVLAAFGLWFKNQTNNSYF